MSIHDLIFLFAGICVLCSLVISIYLIRKHQTNFTVPEIQSKIIGILWMVPIYAITSWLSVGFPSIALFLDLLRDSYESYIIYLFLALMLSYLRSEKGGFSIGDRKVIRYLEKAPTMDHPFPCSLCCGTTLPRGVDFLRYVKFLVLQYCLAKPLSTLVAFGLELAGKYEEGSFDPQYGYLYLSFLLNLSVTAAFYGLTLFYVALHRPLAPFHPIPKFLTIKLIVMVAWWQSIVIALLSHFQVIHDFGSYKGEEVAIWLQDTLICLEMALAAVGHLYAFDWQPFERKARDGGSLLEDPLIDEESIETVGSSFLRNNFATDAALRDYNEVMPVLLPSSFTPQPVSVQTRYLHLDQPSSSSSSSSVDSSSMVDF